MTAVGRGTTPDNDRGGGDRGDGETRDRILQAGITCMARYGRSKTTLQDVADAAGLSRATLYRYFADRGALLTAIRDHEQELDAAQLRDRLGDVSDLTTAVSIVAEVLAATMARYRMSEHLAAGDTGLAGFVSRSRDGQRTRIHRLLAPYVQRAAAAGELAPDVAADEALEWLSLTLADIAGLTAMASVDVRDPVAVGRWFTRLSCRGMLR